MVFVDEESTLHNRSGGYHDEQAHAAPQAFDVVDQTAPESTNAKHNNAYDESAASGLRTLSTARAAPNGDASNFQVPGPASGPSAIPGNTPVKIVGRHRGRAFTLIKVDAASTSSAIIQINDPSSLFSGIGFVVEVGSSVTLPIEAAIYAIGQSGPCTVSVIVGEN